MKKSLLFVLTLAMLFSLCACGGEAAVKEPEEPAITKEDLSAVAKRLMNDEVEQAFSNPAFAKTLVGNTYFFEGEVYSIEVDYADVALNSVPDDVTMKRYSYDYWNLSVHVYLPVEELATISCNDTISIVGTVSNAETKKTADPLTGLDINGTVIIMEDAFLNND